MKKEEILEKLKLPGRQLDRNVLEEIQKQASNYKEDLLAILNREADNPQNPASRMEYNDWIYAMYLLAEIREKKAYRPILKLFTRPGNFLNQNQNINEYCRAACIETLVIMVEIGELEREELYHYFVELFNLLERSPIFPWTVLAQSAILVFKKSFLKEVKQSFKNQLIDDIYLDMEEVKSYLSNPELSQLALAKKKYGIIIDAVSALEWWINFKESS